LFCEGAHVGQAVRAVGYGDGQMGQDDTGIVGVPGDPAVLHGHRHGRGQPAAISQLGEQRGTSMADQILAVGYHFGATDRATTVHFKELSSWLIVLLW
jgi:hypothetical protein